MQFIKGYKFNTKEQANSAMNYLNSEHGLPIEGGLTQFDESSYQLHPNGFYYIVHDNNWTYTLGQPTDIELPKIEFPL